MFKKLIAAHKHRQVIRKLRKLEKITNAMLRKALADNPLVILRHVPKATSFVRRPNPVPNCRIRFTVQEPGEDMRKLTFSIIAGNPVTICTVKDRREVFTHIGISVCKHGDKFDLPTGVRKAFENSIVEMEFSSIESALIGKQFGKEIAKL